jgi:Family of unknown function (DUF5522)
LQWTDPIFVGGHWTPQLIQYAGGEHTLNPAGKEAQGMNAALSGAGKSFPVPIEVFVSSDPDIIIIAPCGFDLTQAHDEAITLLSKEWFSSLRAVRSGHVYAVDGDAMFNRPGPRLVEAMEWLGSIINPNDLELKYLAKCFPCIQLPPSLPIVSSTAKDTANHNDHTNHQSVVTKPIDVVISVEEAHLAACNAEESMYVDPHTKLHVFTEHAHRKRGKCCGNMCRHCPYGHYNVSTNKRTALIKKTDIITCIST